MRLPLASGMATAAVTLTLYPLFDGGAWLAAALGAILAVTATGLLVSHYTLPSWTAPIGTTAVLWIYLTAVFAGDAAWARLIPTPDSVRTLMELIGTGFADIQRYAAPVPERPGITLITAGGVGVIAVVVDLLAVRLRKAAVAGLPLLTLFIVPAEIVSDPLAWPAFIIAALGYTGLLAADGRERVGRWGHVVLLRRNRSVTTRPASSPSHLRLSGKRVGITAIALAVLVPALLPTLEPNPLFGFGVGSGTGRGGNTISIPNPIVSLRGQLSLPESATVLTYTSSDGAPRYLRMWSLDLFTGEQWTMTPPTGKPENRVENGPLPAPPGQTTAVPTTRAQLRIQISEDIDDLQFLPLPYPPIEVRAEGDWRADVSTLMVFSTRDDAGGLAYEVVSEQPRPTPELLDAAGPPPQEVQDRYLRLPRDLPVEIRRLARQVTRDEDTPYRKAVRLQEWFTQDGGFAYSVQTEGHGNSALVDFLINSRVGYCEQFAASMAVMARILGIPSRVAIGYTGGSSVGGVWQVSTHDMHAWPELYFEGVGWLAFEPTPSGGLGQGTARPPEYSLRPPERTESDETDDGPSASEESDTTGGGGETAAPRNPRLLDREDALTPTTAPQEESQSAVQMIAAGIGVLVLIALIPAAMRVMTRRRRLRAAARPGVTARATAGDPADAARDRTAPVSAAWAELDDVLYDYGMTREVSETPRALARRLTEQYRFDGEQAAAIDRIAAATERTLFAPSPGATGTLAADLRTVRQALAASVPRGRRIRVALLPPSALRRLRRMGTALLDGFDGLEDLRLRRPVRRNG